MSLATHLNIQSPGLKKTYEEKFAFYESRLEELENERSEKCVETDAKVVTLGHKLGKIEKENLEKNVQSMKLN